MRIAILGAGGFIGSHLVEHLLARGEHVVVGLDLVDDKLEGITGTNFIFHQADVRSCAAVLEGIIRDADLVVDLVAYANPSIYVTAPLEVFDLNFTQNLDVARLCMKHRKRLIQYSTAEVYGKAGAGDTFSEDTTDLTVGPVHRQRWIYATAKILLERVLYAHGAAGDLDYTIIRPFNFIGPRIDYLVPANTMGGPRVFPHFMSALLTGGPLRLVDGGTVHRTFMHIHDANAAFQTLLDRPEESRNQIYNFGNPDNNITIRQLAALMMQLFEELTGAPSTSEVLEIDAETFYGEGYEDGDRYPPDITKMRALGWSPKRDLRTTFRESMEYYLRTTVPGALGVALPARDVGPLSLTA